MPDLGSMDRIIVLLELLTTPDPPKRGPPGSGTSIPLDPFAGVLAKFADFMKQHEDLKELFDLWIDLHNLSHCSGEQVDERSHLTAALIFCLNEAGKFYSQSTNGLETLSAKYKLRFSAALEFLVAAGMLPCLDPGVGIPLPKRSAMVKLWQTIEDRSLRIAQLKLSINCLFYLTKCQEYFARIISGTFLQDLIAANEQLIRLGCDDCKTGYESFLTTESVNRQNLFRELLALIGGICKPDVTDTSASPVWLRLACGIRLSRALIESNGLVLLIAAVNDSGGESFWHDYRKVSAFARVLASRPQHYPADKYYTNILKQLLNILKADRDPMNWKRCHMTVFAATVARIYAIRPKLVDIEIVDPVLRPWETMLLNDNSLSNGANIWTAEMECLTNVLVTWVMIMEPDEVLPDPQRFLKILPLLFHLYAMTIKAAALEMKENPLQNLELSFLRIITRVLMHCKLSEDDGAKMQLSWLIPSTPNESLMVKYGHWVLRLQKRPLIMEVSDEDEEMPEKRIFLSKLENPGEETNEEKNLAMYTGALMALQSDKMVWEQRTCFLRLLKNCMEMYADGKNSTFDENSWNGELFMPISGLKDTISHTMMNALYVQRALIEATMDCFTGKLHDFGRKENECEMALQTIEFITIIIKFNLKTNSVNVGTFDVRMRPPTADNEDENGEMNSVRLAMGILGTILISLEVDQPITDALTELAVTLRHLVQSTEENGGNGEHEDEKKLLAADAKKILELLEENYGIQMPSTSTETMSNHHENRAIPKLKPNPKVTDFAIIEADLNDMEPAIRGHGLLAIAKKIRERDTQYLVAIEEKFLPKILECLNDSDSYVFLAAVNALAELGFYRPDPYLLKMADIFADWSSSPPSVPISEAAVDKSVDSQLVARGRLGEALARVCRRLGPMAPVHYDRLLGVFLHLTKEPDELLRASAMSSLADLVAAAGPHKMKANRHELLYCINQLLNTDRSPLVRRSATHLIRALISTAGKWLIEEMSDTLLEMYRLLKRLKGTDGDYMVRLHADLALGELDAIMKTSEDPGQMNGQMRILKI